ncbi:MAG: S-formylglutathione hydrolase [Gammaproteobacteria bacterium]|nr:S-formylglutathione hydrolase [Gammaproteobacteria bacterium]MDH3448040.1 S-formylglutathione hydrolase [Gammaproteobacteria bacterium]
MKEIESIKESGGYLNRYTHESSSCHCEMTFSVYLPPRSRDEKVPALYWLSGLTCSDDNARTKGGFQRFAARHGIAIVFPDTSPRGADVADEPDRYDLGQAAGFYVNATQDPWRLHYQMFDYVTHELPALIEDNLPLMPGVRSITGHSMGGHGALICALRLPDAYRSVSAFAPIANPVNCPWGQGCFGAYLGDDTSTWEAWDATCLVRSGARVGEILIDQGDADEFLHEGQLLPDNFQAACDAVGQSVNIRMQPGYDHSYHFIASFIEDHFEHHAKHLRT